MISFPTEEQLVASLDRCDELVRLCAAGKISFHQFSAAYDNFYWSFPLDGHESDAAGLAVLSKYSVRIAPHQSVAEKILSKICADTDATEAVARLKVVAAGLPAGEA